MSELKNIHRFMYFIKKSIYICAIVLEIQSGPAINDINKIAF